MRRLLRSLLLLSLASAALAGGGPETTLVIVNARSPMSRRVANEYVELRDIPQSHLLYLEGIPHLGVVSLDFFRNRIWKPIAEHLQKVGPISLITYSADFPYGVNFRPLLGDKKPPMTIGGIASLTGVTYLIQQVEAGGEFWNLQINPYFGIRFPGPNKRRRATAEERGYALAADQAMRAQSYAKAAEAFAKLLATYEEAPQPWYNYACCLARTNKPVPAIRALRKAVETGWRNAGHTAGDPDLASLRARPAFKALLKRMRESPGIELLPSRGFDSKGSYLSTQLAYTGFRGNSLSEILQYLRRSAQSDGSRPKGTVYILKNKDVRSRSREPFFPLLMSGLKKRGRKVELIEGVLPVKKDDVIGAVIGRATFSWAKSGSAMLPGAICEHLTSHGANFGTPGQTKITEFMRFGAAGSSGTVMEPLALHQKFPNPAIHLFYADGCSLAESFYQSVWGPYQLMVIGDGLARPFAEFETIQIKASPTPWTQTETILPSGKADRYELWVDGTRVAEGSSFQLDTTKFEEGYHDVRVVGIRGKVQTRSYKKIEAVFNNHDKTVEVTEAQRFQGLTLKLKTRGAKRYELWQGARMLASSADGELTLDARDAGPGPFRVVPRVVFHDRIAWRGKPIRYDLDALQSVDDTGTQPKQTRPGLAGSVDGREIVVTNLGDRHSGMRLREQIKGKAKKISLKGWFTVSHKGFFQFVVRGSGRVSIQIPSPLCKSEPLDAQLYLPVALDEGLHAIQIEYEPNGRPDLEIMLGGDQVLAPLELVHDVPVSLKRQPQVEGDLKSGLILAWKRPVAGITAVTLTPKSGQPTQWRMEWTTARKWRPVKDLRVLVAPGKKTPAFVTLTLSKPLRAKRLRILAEGESEIAGVDVSGK